ncbi:hypothetical protein C8J57DRAFT_1334644 [Mycena rebaudengoi]|nr:hypothetical protein C8J57DRAFT_1334644 [Mycena rebaudengoi]
MSKKRSSGIANVSILQFIRTDIIHFDSKFHFDQDHCSREVTSVEFKIPVLLGASIGLFETDGRIWVTLPHQVCIRNFDNRKICAGPLYSPGRHECCIIGCDHIHRLGKWGRRRNPTRVVSQAEFICTNFLDPPHWRIVLMPAERLNHQRLSVLRGLKVFRLVEAERLAYLMHAGAKLGIVVACQSYTACMA